MVGRVGSLELIQAPVFGCSNGGSHHQFLRAMYVVRVSAIKYIAKSHRIEGPGWSLPVASYTEGSESTFGPSNEASIRIRHKVYLSVQWDDTERSIYVELFDGETDEPIGLLPPEKHVLAILPDKSGRPRGIARVALCACGDRGCGNVSTQFAHAVPPESFPGLVDVLSDLPNLNEVANDRKTLLNDFDHGSHHLFHIPEYWNE